MNSTKADRASSINEIDARAIVKRIITMVDELALVIEEENKILARGVPASLTKSITRKNELADAFEAMVKQVADHQLCSYVGDAALRQDLVVRVKALRVVMAENTDRLRAAIDATRRRIEAVMRAIRAEMTIGKPSYGANGRLQDSRAPQSIRGNGVCA